MIAGTANPTIIPKDELFGVGISRTDYETSVDAIIAAARVRRSYAVTALATHGLMLAADDPEFRKVVNGIDLVTPDGQPVRWAMNVLHGAGLGDRVYGPELMKRVCAAAADAGISIYLFGSSVETCERLSSALRTQHPALNIAGVQPDRFREASAEEDADDIRRINASAAGIVFVGRGCPRQERWVVEHRTHVNAAMVAVGAAFDYHAGTLRRPPPWMQSAGLEWLHRLSQEPRRLAGRYVRYNARFLARFGIAVVQQLVTRR